jgi:hypothetical protein
MKVFLQAIPHGEIRSEAPPYFYGYIRARSLK